MVQKTLQFKETIILCYNKQASVRVIHPIPPLFTWHMSQIMVNTIVIACVSNQSKGHWLLSNVEEMNHCPNLDALIDDDLDLDIEFRSLARNIKKEVCGVIDFILSFLTRYDKRRVHNMLALMLNLRFKSLKLNSSFIGREYC